MFLTFNFNNSFKAASPSDQMSLSVYMSSTYGSNSYCHDKAATIIMPSNDVTGAEAMAEGPRKFLPQLA